MAAFGVEAEWSREGGEGWRPLVLMQSGVEREGGMAARGVEAEWSREGGMATFAFGFRVDEDRGRNGSVLDAECSTEERE